MHVPRRAGLAPVVILFAFASAFGCSGNGCSCLGTIPGGFPSAKRNPNAAQVRVSQSGIAALTADPAALVSGLLGGGPLTFNVPASCGGQTPVCCPGGVPQNPCGPIVIDLAAQPNDLPRLEIVPQSGQSKVNVTVRARIHTMMDLPVQVPIIGNCGLHIDTAPGPQPDIKIDAPVALTTDGVASTTRIDVPSTTISQLTGEDVHLTGNFACQGASFLLSAAVGTITSTFQDAIKNAINDQACKKCPVGNECGPFATCMSGTCTEAGGQCLQELGAEGRLAGALPGTTGAFDVYEVAGGYKDTDQNGISLGLMGGMVPAGTMHDRCGPPATEPPMPAITQSPFFLGNTATGIGPFDIGIGVHKSQLDHFAYAAYDGGALCITIGHSTVDLLTTDTFQLFIHSLPNLADGSRPMAVGLRPQEPPQIVLGTNTFVSDGMGGMTVGEPLLDVTFHNLEIDFFVQVEDQYIRAFTLASDLHLPVGLQVGAMGELTPVLGNTDNAFTNLTVKNNQPLLESSAELEAAFPMILQLALPQLIGGLGSFQVPSLGGLNINVTHITAVDNKSFLAIYGTLMAGSMLVAPVDTHADLLGQTVPGTEVFDDARNWSARKRPTVELALGGTGDDLEYSLRIDGGTWSAWSPTARRTVTSDLFWLQGKHQIEVRAREPGLPSSVDPTPAVVPVVIDTLPPEPELAIDGDQVRISGHDLVSGDALHARWRIAGGDWHEAATPVVVDLHGARPIDLSVELRDEAGNMSPTRGSTAIERADFHGAPSQSGCNCRSSDPEGGAVLVILVALGLLARGRWRRLWQRVAVLALGAVLPACNCGGTAACGDKDCLPGEVEHGVIGLWNGAASDGTRIVATTYDETLGDLVLADLSGSDPSFHVVDGVPDETPTYDPGTYRGGIETPGPDVGLYTSVMLQGGLARMAYQDADNRALRYAVETKKDKFSSHEVDGPDTDAITVGLYTSIASAGNNPAIAYMATGIAAPDGTRHAELRLSRARTPNPSTTADWTTTVVASAVASCAGLCGNQTCVAGAAAGDPETCVTPSTDCASACATGEACVAGACRKAFGPPKVKDMPTGTGLFANLLALSDGRLVIVHYDRSRPALVAEVENAGASTFTETVLDGAPGTDRGMFASAVVDAGGVVHVAYQDAQGDQVYYLTFTPGGAPSTPELVDDGVRAGDRTHPVGAGITIWLESGAPKIAYQDGASSDLVVASKAGGAWTHVDQATGDLLDGFHIAAPDDGRALVWDQLDKTHSPPHGLAVWKP